MLNYLVSFSTWAESNSGQIQILIGILALSLAIFGYRQIIEQIKIAKNRKIVQMNKENLNLRYNPLICHS